MQNRLNYSNAEHNDTSITVHLQDSSYLVRFLNPYKHLGIWCHMAT